MNENCTYSGTGILTMSNLKSAYSVLNSNDGWYLASSDCDTVYINNNKQNMKETKQTLHTVVFQETKVTEYSYEVLAENLEDAKSLIENGAMNKQTVVSLERVIKS